MEMLFNDVSDTALWIAAYRAQETERVDAVFRDWLAARLAGIRGYQMAATMPHTKAMAFAMVVRTAAIDRLVTAAVSQGIDTVINLGSGLDTRPYRMKLPVNLRWIEVDFPATIHYKNEKLAGEGPVCRLERIAMDLANESQREMLFCQLGDEIRSALVITEGVIPYLTNCEAASLSRSLHAIPSFKYWIQDYSHGKMRRSRQTKDISKRLGSAQWQFTENDPVKFFGGHGWKVREDLHILDEADRIGRRFPTMFPLNLLLDVLPRSMRQLGNNSQGYVMFAR
jgi:methyltransferase (TIGR00027 family)